MALAKYEKTLLDRLIARGYPIDRSQEGAPFTFTISPVTTVGVDVSVLINLGRAIIAEIKDQGFRCELSGLVVFPRICDPNITKAEPLLSFKRKDNAYYVGLGIDFEAWSQGSSSDRLSLALSNLRQSPRRMG